MEAMDGEDSCESLFSISDDSDDDPSFSAVDRTRRPKLSNLSVRKNSSPSDDEFVVDYGEVEEVDEKSYDEIQRIVRDGKTEKLKIEQCKIYLRKNGLRLTGNKATLIQRINEHFEISNGGGERKYPVSSFYMNCKGDACTGDVVLFEQNVYDTYSIVSRSATGPPCGTRRVAGRIVKESYGAAKQQHTFTVEVLWSRGEKPLPPLHPLLIKGRNLYRLKTMRQRWDDEEERRRMLNEKHARGSLARSSREARIEEKERRKGLKENRGPKREPRKNHPDIDLASVLKPSVQPLGPFISKPLRSIGNQMIGPGISVMAHHVPYSTNVQAQNRVWLADCYKVTEETQPKKSPFLDNMHMGPEASQRLTGNTSFNNREPRFYPGVHEVQHTRNQPHFNPIGYTDWSTRRSSNQPFTGLNTYQPVSPSRREYSVNNYHQPKSPARKEYGVNCHRPISPARREYGVNNYHRPISTASREYGVSDYRRPISPPRRHYSRPVSPLRRENFVPRKPCHHYARGRCHYGETCKFSHSIRE